MGFEGGRLRLSASDVANFVPRGHVTRLDPLRAGAYGTVRTGGRVLAACAPSVAARATQARPQPTHPASKGATGR